MKGIAVIDVKKENLVIRSSEIQDAVLEKLTLDEARAHAKVKLNGKEGRFTAAMLFMVGTMLSILPVMAGIYWMSAFIYAMLGVKFWQCYDGEVNTQLKKKTFDELQEIHDQLGKELKEARENASK